jgi:hypothetical protein
VYLILHPRVYLGLWLQLKENVSLAKELTYDAKAWNRIVSGFRVLVEHAIGGVKRFGIVSHKFQQVLYLEFKYSRYMIDLLSVH